MNLKRPFYKLPVILDVTPARQEVSKLITEAEWIDHASGFAGNSYIPLTSYQGTINNLKRTPIKQTYFAERLEEVSKLLRSFNFTIGISRLMKLAPGYCVPVHSDTNEYWDDRVRIHIPLMTSDKVFFSCGNEEVVMAEGEAWTFNNWIKHGVRNEGNRDRIHLVFDTKSSNILDDTGSVHSGLASVAGSETFTLEQEPSRAIKRASELKSSLQVLIDELNRMDDSQSKEVRSWYQLITNHLKKWEDIEKQQGTDISAIPGYQAAIKTAFLEADNLGSALRLKTNKVKVETLFKSRVQQGINLKMLFNDG